MQTYEEQEAFFEKSWPAMREALESGGPERAVAFIQGYADPLERRVLFMFASNGILHKEWRGDRLDAWMGVADAGIQEILAASAAAPDDAARARLLDSANVLSYNLAADLADCWPGDDLPRHARHHERALRAAEDCIRWRDELGKPDAPRSMAHWARGVHLLALARPADAASAFQRALDHGHAAARAAGRTGDVTASGGFLAIGAAGYLGIAELAAGDPSGAKRYDDAIAAFRTQAAEPALREDAEMGLGQLEKVHRVRAR